MDARTHNGWLATLAARAFWEAARFRYSQPHQRDQPIGAKFGLK
jgi:hypothetical protein